MNDPNGMVYYAGEYHLFYQYYPDSNVWGPMHWGHAVSRDLVHWEQLPIALYPDELGYIFSGSAVVDRKNTSGFGTADNPPLVAIYTYHDPIGAEQGRVDFQTQGIAYSLDSGRNWIKYEGNPVLDNPGIIDFRDPKVFYHEDLQKWIMTLAVKDHISFYSSADLKTWTFESDFGADIGAHGGVWECPDLFMLRTSEGNNYWVLLVSINPGGPAGGSATQYFVGDFDGNSFTPKDTTIRWVDYGADNYAGVTWSDFPAEDGRRLFLGWMSNWDYAQVVPTYQWRSAMTIPRVLQLSEDFRLQSVPVEELNLLEGQTEIITEELAMEYITKEPLFKLDVELSNGGQGTLIIANGQDEQVVIELQESEIIFDRTKSGMVTFSEKFEAFHGIPLDGLKPSQLTIYVDASSIEVFVDEGLIAITELVFPNAPYDRIMFTPNPETNVKHAEITYLESIW